MKNELPWDPEMESPASIAVLGGGPLGIEAALYGRFLGYFVSIFESRRVGHRMLDWHRRPLVHSTGAITTPLGHAALAAQNPEYRRPDLERRMTGQEYADEYLIPLAKSDLLFDDIHFLSPVVDISRYRTFQRDPVGLQERCNDEFRILVHGRHRGWWTSRVDCVLDCRGYAIESIGMAPGGGLAIGEREAEPDFLVHLPEDRKFEPKMLAGKHWGLVGQSERACLGVEEFLRGYPKESGARLTWIVRPRGPHDTHEVRSLLARLASEEPGHVVVLEALGVEQIERTESGKLRLRLLKEDDSSLEVEVQVVTRCIGDRYRSIAPELAESPQGPMPHANTLPGLVDSPSSLPPCVTSEPGYYSLGRASHAAAPDSGLPEALQRIREVYACIGGRDDLDLYALMDRQTGSP